MTIQEQTIYDCIIIGAGAAGMMCAAEAGKRGRRVLLLDHAQEIGNKIRISGGGRCNFTNQQVGAENYNSQNPHFCKSALSRYTPDDFIALVEAHNIPYHEKKLGQLFCTEAGGAKRIVQLLLDECREACVRVENPCMVYGITNENDFYIKTSSGDFQSESLVIATGGLSIPKIGASDFGYRVARQFGLAIVQTRPALDGFVLHGEDFPGWQDLSGTSIDCTVTVNKTTFRENLLCTHKGLSGPAMLQISLYWKRGDELRINLLPDVDVSSWLAKQCQLNPNATLETILREHWSKRFSTYFCEHYLTGAALKTLSEKSQTKIANTLQDWRVSPTKTIGYEKAEVTAGGIDTRALSSKTMQANTVPGLYFIGEVMDVSGWLGGYNFQWAWSSAVAAGQVI